MLFRPTGPEKTGNSKAAGATGLRHRPPMGPSLSSVTPLVHGRAFRDSLHVERSLPLVLLAPPVQRGSHLSPSFRWGFVLPWVLLKAWPVRPWSSAPASFAVGAAAMLFALGAVALVFWSQATSGTGYS